MSSQTLTLLDGHPDPASFTHALAARYARGAEAEGVSVLSFEVARLDFDPALRGGHRAPRPDEPDLARVRAAIERSARVVWFFPTWWAGMPAVMKGLVDRLFLPGWAYRYEGGPLPRGLLAPRSSRWVTTMDSPRLWYLLAHHDALGGAFGRGTLRFSGFSPVERTVLYGVRRMGERARRRWLERMEALGRRDARHLLS